MVKIVGKIFRQNNLGKITFSLKNIKKLRCAYFFLKVSALENSVIMHILKKSLE